MKPALILQAARLAACVPLACAASLAHAQQTYKVAIAQFGPDHTLDTLVSSFKKELARQGLKVSYDEGHVNFDRSLAPQLLNREAAGKPDLMLTITTPLTQTAKQVLANRSFPIVFGAVANPVAAKLVPSWDRGDTLMTGGSNLPNMDASVGFIKQLTPGVKRLGIIYNPGDDADLGYLNALEKVVGKYDLTLVKVGVDNANDIPTRVASLQGRADALMVPASSMLIPAAAAIASVTNRIKLPTYSPNVDNVAQHHFLAAMTVEYTSLGTSVGRIAADVLRGRKPADIPVSVPAAEDHAVKISGRRLKDLGIALPESLKNCNCVVD